MFSSNTSQVVSADFNYIEDVFSTYLYTGNGSTQTITNGIDLAGKGGMVWTKERSPNARNHFIGDSARNNFRNYIYPNLTNSESGLSSAGWDITSVSSTGYSLGVDGFTWNNEASSSQVSWTFRKQPKFFDVVTYTGNASSRSIAHSLGSAPGMMIIKCTSEANTWVVYHRSLANPQSDYLALNTTAAVVTGNTFIWDNQNPTSTNFFVGGSGFTNNTGQTYVAYLFAHNAGGFGLTGTDNVISCGSYVGNGGTTDATGQNITLGYEPQFLLVKSATSTSGNNSWALLDVMRGWDMTEGNDRTVYANASAAENAGLYGNPTSTGFRVWDSNVNASGVTYIYIAIRRGPMKTPTVGTSVFSPITYSGNGTNRTLTTGFPTDLFINKSRDNYTRPVFYDRLRGTGKALFSNNTNLEASYTDTVTAFNNTTVGLGVDSSSGGNGVNFSGYTYIGYGLGRAPGFFDEVCYTQVGTSGIQTINHNLAAVPELVIVKTRGSADNWRVRVGSYSGGAIFNSAAAFSGSIYVDNLTSTTFGFNLSTAGVANGETFVSYLFATCPGVSKVGSYTGNGSSQTIACGFAAGARFVLIKRTDSTGDWYVWDTSRGISSGNDPYYRFNLDEPEVTSNNTIDPANSGFIVNQVVATNVNVSSATYIFLAIA